MDDILINGNRKEWTKFLRAIIDNKLYWSPHIMRISKIISKGTGIIIEASKLFDNETPSHCWSIPQSLYLCMEWSIWYPPSSFNSITKQGYSHYTLYSSANLCGQFVCDALYVISVTSLLLQCLDCLFMNIQINNFPVYSIFFQICWWSWMQYQTCIHTTCICMYPTNNSRTKF